MVLRQVRHDTLPYAANSFAGPRGRGAFPLRMFLLKLSAALMSKTLVYDDDGRHRRVNHAVARFGKGEAKAASRENGRIEGLLIRRDGMGHAVMVRPGHLGTHFDGEAIGAEREVHNRDAIPSAGCGRCWSRRWVGRRVAAGASAGAAGGKAYRRRQPAARASTQPGFYRWRGRYLLHFSSSFYHAVV